MIEYRAALMRVGAIAGNTYREAVRMRLFLFLALSGMASLGVSLYFQEFNLGSSELRFIADFGFGGMTFLGSIMAVIVTVQLVFGEIEHRTIMPLLAKPVSRAEFIAGKLVGAWMTICSFIAILTISLIAALWLRESQLSGLYSDRFSDGIGIRYGDVVLFALLQCLRLIVLASLAAFFASYATSSLFAIFMSFLLWIIGQMHAIAYEQMSLTGERAMEYFLRFVTLAVPDFRLFDLGSEVLEGQGIALGDFLQLSGYALAYTLLYSLLALLSLKKREL